MVSKSHFSVVLLVFGPFLVLLVHANGVSYQLRSVRLIPTVEDRLEDQLQPFQWPISVREIDGDNDAIGQQANSDDEEKPTSGSDTVRDRYLQSRNSEQIRKRYMSLTEYLKKSLFIKRAMMMMDRQPLRFG